MSTRTGIFAVPAVLAVAAWMACTLPAQANGDEEPYRDRYYGDWFWHRGFYVSGFLGSAFGGKAKFDGAVDAHLEAGILGGGALGFDHLFAGTAGDFRIEAEASYRHQNFDASEGEVSITTLMGNVWYDFAMHHSIVPYAGLGFGVAFLDEADDQAGLAFQAGGGINYHLNYRVFVGLNYRYLLAGFDVDGLTENVEIDYRAHQFSLSGGFKF